MRQRQIGIILSVFMMLTGCAGPETGAELKHTLDEPTRSDDPTQWADLTPQEYKEVLLGLVGMARQPIVEPTSPLVERSQFWVSALDQKIRADHPEQMANVPKPVAKVMQESSVNAFIAPVPVCYNVKIAATGSYDAAGAVDYMFLDRANGQLSAWPSQYYECKYAEASEAQVTIMVQSMNARLAGCEYQIERTNGEMVLVPSLGCSQADDLRGATSARGLVVFQTANAVTIHTALMAAMTEEQFVAVVAHELGHYYRAHGVASELDYDFFYTLNEQNPTVKPAPEAALQDLGEKAVAAATLLNLSDSYTAVDGQRYRSDLMFAIGTLVVTVGDGIRASAACGAAARTLQARYLRQSLGQFPYAKLDQTNKEAYDEFETAVTPCLETLTLVGGSRLTPDQVGWEVLQKMVRSPTWPEWVERSRGDMARTLTGQFNLNHDRMGASEPENQGNLDEVFVSLSASFDDQDKKSIATLEEANAKRVGHYTAEQEADDLSAEWLADLGLNPRASIEAMRELGKKRQTRMGGMLLGFTECEDLYNNDWRQDDGRYYFVPIGDYSEVHHSSCYRMFNLDREIKAHNLTAGSNVPPTPPATITWSALQQMADDLSQVDLATMGGANKFTERNESVARALERAMGADCLFSPK